MNIRDVCSKEASLDGRDSVIPLVQSASIGGDVLTSWKRSCNLLEKDTPKRIIECSLLDLRSSPPVCSPGVETCPGVTEKEKWPSRNSRQPYFLNVPLEMLRTFRMLIWNCEWHGIHMRGNGMKHITNSLSAAEPAQEAKCAMITCATGNSCASTLASFQA